jgi:lipopolysaccharide transport system ATP-binding protein
MPAIEVHGLSKSYRLAGRHGGQYSTLRDAISGVWRRDSRTTANDVFWALRDVSFEVDEGQALGIIGRNGAGKSTLLRILSRITEPTSGRASLRGRVASLLEVGTGFHPELTGRENIYLNGTILGMTRAEVRRRFDEIVAFAEVEKFLETPVKHYSSGMYMRLAFGVAAHMTPEILIVDEVLAVGDHEFQRRCLGKMSEVAHSGRTVLFVSHNMTAIEELCPKTVLLKQGMLEREGATPEVIAHYLSSASNAQHAWEIDEHTEREGTGHARITRLRILDPGSDTPLASLPFRQSWRVRLHYRAERALEDPRFGFALLSDRGERVFQTETTEVNYRIPSVRGEGWLDCVVSAPNILPGHYLLEAWIIERVNVAFADHIYRVGRIEIVVDPRQQEQMAYLTHPGRGHVFMDCRWSAAEAPETP